MAPLYSSLHPQLHSRLTSQAFCLRAGIAPDKKEVTFGRGSNSGSSSSTSNVVTEQYDLLVGADGIGSTVRGALQELYPDMTVVVTDSGREYKTYRGLTGSIEPPGEPVNGGRMERPCCCWLTS